MRLPKFTQTWSGREWTEFILTSFIGFFTFVNAIAAVSYYCIYKKSSDETSRQTDKLIYAANTQAEAADKMAKASATQASEMTELAAQASEQNGSTNLLAQQTKRYADIASEMCRRTGKRPEKTGEHGSAQKSERRMGNSSSLCTIRARLQP